jgi:CRP-like cAMP-binding protein
MDTIPLRLKDPRQNHLLAVLPKVEQDRLFPHLNLVQIQLWKILYESGEQISHVYFPATAIISLLSVINNGGSAEIAIVGNEGIVGIALFLDAGTMPSQAVVQSAGAAFRLPGPILLHEFNRSGPFQHLLLRYTMAQIAQIAQTVICNRHHTIEQQLCRWLLLSLDRLPSNELSMTQELIANMLGVRRSGVTVAAGKLHREGLIDYSRGHITVLDRPALEARVCECYKVARNEFARLLPDVIAK